MRLDCEYERDINLDLQVEVLTITKQTSDENQ